MSESIEDLFSAISSLWDSLVPREGLPNLHELPHQLHEAIFSPGGLFDKLTNNGTVPLPLPSSWTSSNPPPTPPPRVEQVVNTSPLPRFKYDFYLYLIATLSFTTGVIYYPLVWKRFISLLLPGSVLPLPKNRPFKNPRRECSLVLGADTLQGKEIALDLEKRGYVVICTVSDPRQVDILEKHSRSRGYLKVLVLDPRTSSSVSPFLRSLSTALSLRFPLNSSGDPFARPNHSLVLTSLIDCLSLSSSSTTAMMSPLEGLEMEEIKSDLTERLSSFILYTKGVLPLLRSSSDNTSVYLLLLPLKSSNLSLPFESLSSSLCHSLESLFHSLRREISLSSSSSSLNLSILQVAESTRTTTTTAIKPLPIRLSSLYAPALSRRQSTSSVTPPPLPPNNQTSSRLTRKISQLLLHPMHSPVISLLGSSGPWEVLKYYYLGGRITHHRLIDWVIVTKDWFLTKYYQSSFTKRTTRNKLGGGQGQEKEKRDIPEVLKPRSLQGFNQRSQVPINSGFFVPNSEGFSRVNNEEEEEEEDEASSIEDLGISPAESSSVYMTGSFVNV